MDCDSLGTSKDREAERDDRGWSDGEKKKMKRKRARCFVNKVQSNIKKPLSIASSMFPSQEDYRHFLEIDKNLTAFTLFVHRGYTF